MRDLEEGAEADEDALAAIACFLSAVAAKARSCRLEQPFEVPEVTFEELKRGREQCSGTRLSLTATP